MSLTQFNLYVTYVEKEKYFIKIWGQVDRKSVDFIDSYLVQLNEQFNKGTGKPHPSTLSVGQMICAQYNGIFYRAKVTNITNLSAGFVVIRFVDYGNSKVTSVDNVRIIDATLSGFPPQATEFYLSGVAPLTGSELEDVTIDYMRQHMCYQDLQAVLVASVNDKGFIKVYQNGVNFGDMMVAQKLAVSVDPQHQESLRPIPGQSLPPNTIQQLQWQQQGYVPSTQLPQKANLSNSMYDTQGRMSHPYAQQHVTVHPSGETTIKTFTSPILEPNSEHNVFVSNVEDGPLSFAVQLQAAEQTLIAVTADIAAHRPIPLREPPVPGSVCLARFPGDNKLSRATIMEVMDITCRLYYVDFGNVNDIPYTDIFELPAKLINPKAMALRFCLAGLKNGPPPSTVAKEAFKDIVRGCLLRLRVAPSPEGPPLKQYGYLMRDGRDVRLLYEELAKERIARNVGLCNIPAVANCIPAPLMYDPAKTEAIVDGTWVTISHLNSPDEFWVQLESDQPSLEQVMALLDECCTCSNKIPNIADLKPKSPVFARFSEDDKWYRASVIKIEQGENGIVVYVEFVDYGNEEGIMDLSRLRMAEPAIVGALAAQAIRCRLNGAAIVRSKVGSEMWDKISTKFSDLTLETRGMVKLGPRGVGDPVVVLDELRDDKLTPPVVITMNALYQGVVGTNEDSSQKVNLKIIASNSTTDEWKETAEMAVEDHNANAPARYGDYYSGGSRNKDQNKWKDGSEGKGWEEPKSYSEERGGFRRNPGGRRGHGQEGGGNNWDGGASRSRFGSSGGQHGNEGGYSTRGYKGNRGQARSSDGGDDWEEKESVHSNEAFVVSEPTRGGGRGGRNGARNEWDSGKQSDNDGEFREGGTYQRGGRTARYGSRDSGDSFSNTDDGSGGTGGFRDGRGGRYRGGRDGSSWQSRESNRQNDRSEDFGGSFRVGRGGGHHGDRYSGNWDNKDSGQTEDGEGGDSRGSYRGGRGGYRNRRDGSDSFDSDRGFGGGGYRGSNRGSRGGSHWEGKDSFRQNDGDGSFGGGYRGGRGGHRGNRESGDDGGRSYGGGGYGGRGGYSRGHTEEDSWENSCKKSSQHDGDGDGWSSGGYQGRGGRGGGGDRFKRDRNFSAHGREDFSSSKGFDSSQADIPKVAETGDEDWGGTNIGTDIPTENLTLITSGAPESLPSISLVNVGDKEKVDIAFVESRINFSCHLQKKSNELDFIVNCLAEKYGSTETAEIKAPITSLPPSKPLTLNELTVGMPCAALFSEDGLWYRAIVAGEVKEDKVPVSFIDYGNRGEVSEGEVRELKEELRLLPEQAICCCLVGLERSGDGEEDATMDVDFETEVTSGEFVLEATFVKRRKDDGVVEVVLRNKETGDCLNAKFGGVESVEGHDKMHSDEESEEMVEGGIPHAVTPLDKPLAVEVVYVASRHEFYCQLKESSSELEKVMESLAESCSKDWVESGNTQTIEKSEPAKTSVLSFSTLEVGMPCAALYSEDGLWYRARVAGDVKEERVPVSFIDYGNGGAVAEGEVKELKAELCLLPEQAIGCCLMGLEGSGDGEEDVAMDVDFETEVTSGEFVLEATFMKRRKDKNVVEVVLRKKETGDCLNLRYGGREAPDNGCELNVQEEIALGEANRHLDIPPPVYSFGTGVEVEVVHIVSRLEFYCQLKEKSTELENLMLQLAEACTEEVKDSDSTNIAPLVTLSSLKEGMPCAALFSVDSLWYRARVIGEVKDDKLPVSFVDYGNGGEVSEGEVRELKAELRLLPEQAICCCLMGLEGSGDGEEDATMDIDFETEVTSGEIVLVATFVKRRKDEDLVEVVLTNKETGDSLNMRYGGREEVDDIDQNDEMEASKIVGSEDIPRAEVPFGENVDVEIVYVVGRREFYCQLGNNAEKLADVMSRLATSCTEKEEGEVPLPCESTLRMLGLRPGMPCAALFSADNLWYRALVLDEPKVKECGSGFVVKVKFIDYGNEALVEDSAVQELVPELLALPAHAIPCRLMGLGGDFVPNDDTEAEFEAVTVDPEVSLEALFVRKTEDDSHFEILLKNVNTEENINQRFGAVGEVVGGKGFGMRPAMANGETLDVMVIWFVNPYRFYVQPLDWAPGLVRYMELLQKVSKRTISPWPPSVGTPVLARFAQDGALYRALVEDVTSNSMVRVQYVDYGNREALSSSHVWAADSTFTSLSPQAIPCSLMGLGPIDGPGWPLPGCPEGSLDKYFSIEKCSCVFHGLLKNESEVDGGIEGERRTWVSLIKPDGSNIAEDLVSLGLARAVDTPKEVMEAADNSSALAFDGGQVGMDDGIDETIIAEDLVSLGLARAVDTPKEVMEATDNSSALAFDGGQVGMDDGIDETIVDYSSGLAFDGGQECTDNGIGENTTKELVEIINSLDEIEFDSSGLVVDGGHECVDYESGENIRIESEGLKETEGECLEGAIEVEHLEEVVEGVDCDYDKEMVEKVPSSEGETEQAIKDSEHLSKSEVLISSQSAVEDIKVMDDNVIVRDEKLSEGDSPRSLLKDQTSREEIVGGGELLVKDSGMGSDLEKPVLNIEMAIEKLGELNVVEEAVSSGNKDSEDGSSMTGFDGKKDDEIQMNSSERTESESVRNIACEIENSLCDATQSMTIDVENEVVLSEKAPSEVESTQGKSLEYDEMLYSYSTNSLVPSDQEKDVLDVPEELDEGEYQTTSELAKDVLKSSVDGDKDAAARVQQVVEKYYQELPKPCPIDKIQIGRTYFTLSPPDDPKVVPVRVLDLSGTLGAVVEFEDGFADEVPLDKIYECPPDMAVLPSPEASPMSSLTVVEEQAINGSVVNDTVYGSTVERKSADVKIESCPKQDSQEETIIQTMKE